MNVELLERVRDYILEEPRRLSMGNWIRDVRELYDLDDSEKPPCGTVCCLAGAACILSGDAERITKDGIAVWSLPFGTPKKAQERLGITFEEACRLFMVGYEWQDEGYEGEMGCWPEPFASEYEYARDAKTRAAVAVRRIEHFIKTKGRE